MTLCILMSYLGFAQETLNDLLGQYNTHSIPYISTEELRMLQLNSDIAILDSRELKEYKVSHLKGANFVGFNDFSAKKISDKIADKNTPIIVYCSLGIRSEEIAEKLKKEGFSNVKNLYGGIFEWQNKDYPVFNDNEVETDSIHTFSKPWSKWLLKGVKVY
jgi:rhodanese-related sulfurtransferase